MARSCRLSPIPCIPCRISAGFGGASASSIGARSKQVIAVRRVAGRRLAHVFAESLPLKVAGDVEYLVNRTDNGWVVTLFNNNGVFKPQQGLAQVDRSAYVTATIGLNGRQIQKAIDWISEKDVEVKSQNGKNAVTITIAPGGVAIIELQSRS